MCDTMTVRVKICGITTVEDALMAEEAGADAIGLVLYRHSRRYVDLQQAIKIKQVLSRDTLCVALVVNEERDFVNQVINHLKPSFVQFHGDESPDFCHQFNYPFIRAIRMREGLDVAHEVAQYKPMGGFLFDAWHADQYGGTGEQFDWQRLPLQRKFSLILAGGLNPDNVAQAVVAVNPEMVDVSGGVEQSPGNKDPLLVASFIENAKSVS